MDLKELLGEELYNQVAEKIGENKLAIVSDGNWFPKEKFDEANTAKKKAEESLKERDKQLEELKKSSGDNEELRKQIESLQTENKAAKEQYEAEKQELKLSTALKLALGNSVHDVDMVAGLLDKSIIELGEDGSIKKGYEDQVKALRDNKPFLFVQEPTAPTFRGMTPTDGAPPASTPKKTSEMTYTELAEYLAANPNAQI